MADFAQKNVNVQTNAQVKAIKENSVEYAAGNAINTVQSHLTILAVGQKSYGAELIDELECAGYEVIAVGAVVRSAKLINATSEGYFADLSIKQPSVISILWWAKGGNGIFLHATKRKCMG